MRRVGAVDIGGTKIAAGIVGDDGTILYKSEVPTNAPRGFEHAMSQLREMLGNGIERCGAIEGIGIGCPGPLDPFTGVIGDVGTLPGWKDGDLTQAIGVPMNVSVVVENDADAATLAECAWGATQTSGTLLYVTISTGIGGGIVQGGCLYRGVRGAHPEFGHQVIDPSGPLCYCGISGCWESLASGSAMAAYFQVVSPERGYRTAAQVCALARQGDPAAVRAVEREAHYLGLGMANLVTLFAPEVICLGGGVMQSSELFLEEIRTMVRNLCTQVPAEYTTIALSSLGADIGLLGAAQAWLLRNP